MHPHTYHRGLIPSRGVRGLSILIWHSHLPHNIMVVAHIHTHCLLFWVQIFNKFKFRTIKNSVRQGSSSQYSLGSTVCQQAVFVIDGSTRGILQLTCPDSLHRLQGDILSPSYWAQISTESYSLIN